MTGCGGPFPPRAKAIGTVVGSRPDLGGVMLSNKLSILRLRRFERECRTGSLNANDPLTRQELSELEQTFRRVAMELEGIETQAAATDATQYTD